MGMENSRLQVDLSMEPFEDTLCLGALRGITSCLEESRSHEAACTRSGEKDRTIEGHVEVPLSLPSISHEAQ